MAGWDLALNDRVVCPFNPAHVMNYSKFHNHFVHCKKAHPNDRRKQCPYNASELIHPEDIDEHVVNCEWRPKLQYNPTVDKKDVWSFDDTPFHMKFGESSQPLRKSRLENDTDAFESDEEIDSVSVTNKNQLFNPYVPQHITRNSMSHPPATNSAIPTVRKGFGRGALFNKFKNPTNRGDDIRSPVIDKPKEYSCEEMNIKPSISEKREQFQFDETEFSWLCSKNIEPESTAVCSQKDAANAITEPQEPEKPLGPFLSNEQVYLKLGRGRAFIFREHFDSEW